MRERDFPVARRPIVGRQRLPSLLLALTVSLALLLPAAPPVAAGDDVCPEPNDAFQQACFLGTGAEALGFLSRTNDVDAYRIESLDFNADLRVELADMPFAYRVHLADWQGKIVGESRDEGGKQVIAQKLGPPGAYYLFVDSRFGEFSDGAPYRLGARLTYLGGTPNVRYSTEFRHGAGDQWAVESNDVGRYYARDGRYHVDMTAGGEGGLAAVAWTYWGQAEPYRDFTLITDARMTTPDLEGGFFIAFRSRGDGDTYALVINNTSGEFFMRHFQGTTARHLVPLSPVTGMNAPPNINRIVVRSIGNQHIVNVNGTEIANFRDDALREGRIGLGAFAMNEPVNVVFDNIIVTSPR